MCPDMKLDRHFQKMPNGPYPPTTKPTATRAGTPNNIQTGKSNGKAAGIDNIPAEALNECSERMVE